MPCPASSAPGCAGKSGCLGHGDTAKKAVGRPVKALAGQTVFAAAGGAEWMLVLAGWRPPAGRGGKGSDGKGGTSPRAVQPEVGSPPAGQVSGLCSQGARHPGKMH